VTTEIHGHRDVRVDVVRQAFESNFDDLAGVGACVAATFDGKPVADLRSEDMPLPDDRCGSWGGWGCPLALVDTENRPSSSYVTNDTRESTTGDDRAGRLP